MFRAPVFRDSLDLLFELTRARTRTHCSQSVAMGQLCRAALLLGQAKPVNPPLSEGINLG